MLVRSFTYEDQKGEEKKLVHDVINTCATHAILVHEIADTDYQAQNGSSHDRVFATIKS